jgi:hypothetical protein
MAFPGGRTIFWGGVVGNGFDFVEGVFPASELSGLKKITVRITLSANTADQPIDYGIGDTAAVWQLSGAPFAAGETGTKTFDLSPAQLATVIANGRSIRYEAVIAPGTWPSSGSTTIDSGTVYFYK